MMVVDEGVGIVSVWLAGPSPARVFSAKGASLVRSPRPAKGAWVLLVQRVGRERVCWLFGW